MNNRVHTYSQMCSDELCFRPLFVRHHNFRLDFTFYRGQSEWRTRVDYRLETNRRTIAGLNYSKILLRRRFSFLSSETHNDLRSGKTTKSSDFRYVPRRATYGTDDKRKNKLITVINIELILDALFPGTRAFRFSRIIFYRQKLKQIFTNNVLTAIAYV